MANFLYSGACSDFDRMDRSQLSCDSNSKCVRNDLGCEFEEIVPDSDDEDEELGRREELRKGTELIKQQNGTHFVNILTGEVEEEEYGIVADSEEESDEGKQRQVPNEHGGIVKRRLECLNDSRQSEELSQENALKLVDNFLKCNVLELSSEGKSRSFVKPKSPPNSCVKGVQSLARKICNRTPTVGYSSYEWIDKEPSKKSTLCSKSDVVFYSRRSKRVITNVKSVGVNLGSVSNYQANEEVTDLSIDEAQIGKNLISGSDEVENFGNVPEMIIGNNDNNSNVVTHAKVHKSGVDEDDGNDRFDDVFNTQMAAEVMETLLFEPPKKWNNHASRVLPNNGSETSSSASPVRWLSNDQQLPEQNARDASKNLVYTYKRKRSTMVRKDNKTPNIKLDMAEVKSNIETRMEHKGISTVIPCFNALDSLVFPKGKRTSRDRRSSNLRQSDSTGNARSEGDTEKEVRYPLAKRYKPANRCTEPAWAKFPTKKRTSAAFNKKANVRNSYKAEASRRSNSDLNELRSCVEGAGKNAIFYDSSTFHGSNSLTSVSSNSGVMPLVSSLNSAHFEKQPEKMLKSSLIKELIELGGFTDVPLYSCKNLRRRRHVASIRILLSQHLDNDTIMEQKKVMARLGISIATSATDATHFVTNTFSRTKNMLEAIALGIPIVTQLWLENCAEAGCLVDEKSYILKDSRKEKEIGFSLSSSLSKASRYPLLKGHKVFITPNIKPDKNILSGLVKMVHGEVVDVTMNNQIPEDVIVLSCEEDYAICLSFLAKGISVYHPELLLNGIVTQKLDIQRHRLFQDGVEGHLPHMLKNQNR